MKVLSYEERDQLLRGSGFENYFHYQNSPLWAQIRLRVLQAAGWTCCLCRRRADAVHHSRYCRANLLGYSTQFLHAICGGCHRRVEVDEKGKKRSLEDSYALFCQFRKSGELRRKKGKKRPGGNPEIGYAYRRRALARRRARGC